MAKGLWVMRWSEGCVCVWICAGWRSVGYVCMYGEDGYTPVNK